MTPLQLLQAGCGSCLMPGQLAVTVAELWATGGIEAMIESGNGSPEGVVIGYAGRSIYIQLNAPGVIWMKVSGDGTNTGWAVNT